MSARINIQGQRFGKLTVLSFVGSKNTHAIWAVKCDCGKEFEATYTNLSNENTTACSSCRRRTHGLCGTSYYRRWLTMIENHKGNISREWESFENFKTDTYSTFKEEYSLRREDNTLPYSKENCYWSVPGKKKWVKNDRIYFT